jgi:uncharacterized BrkB/YihY/UPF0761 family membrane protein
MKEVKQIESSLEKAFKGLPDISESGRESIAKILPIGALIVGVLQLVAAWSLYDIVRVADKFSDTVLGSLGVGTSLLSGGDKLFIYLGLAFLVVDSVILLMAYSGLAARKKRGWDLLFLGALLNAAYAVLSLFITGQGFGTFLMNVIGSGLTFWVLFQVKGKFGGKDAVKKAITDKAEEVKVKVSAKVDSKAKSSSKKK